MAVADSHKPHLPDFVTASPFHTEEHESFFPPLASARGGARVAGGGVMMRYHLKA